MEHRIFVQWALSAVYRALLSEDPAPIMHRHGDLFLIRKLRRTDKSEGRT